MYATPFQISTQIDQPKLDRGLESKITLASKGDKQAFHTKGSYRYLNRPLPKDGGLGGLQLLNPPIGNEITNQYIPPVMMSNQWNYTRENIPSRDPLVHEQNMIIDAQYSNQVRSMEAYDSAKDIATRVLPRYDQAHVPGNEFIMGTQGQDRIPDYNPPVHYRQLGESFYPPDSIGKSTLANIKRGVNFIGDNVQQNIPQPFSTREHYTPMKDTHIGHRGYPNPHGYSLIGSDPTHYDVVPRPLCPKGVVVENSCDFTHGDFREGFQHSKKDGSRSSRVEGIAWFCVSIVIVMIFVLIFVAMM